MNWKYIVWTGRMETIGGQVTVRPSCSVAATDTIEEATEKANEWQQRVHRNYPTRKAGHCVITTYGMVPKIVGTVPDYEDIRASA